MRRPGTVAFSWRISAEVNGGKGPREQVRNRPDSDGSMDRWIGGSPVRQCKHVSRDKDSRVDREAPSEQVRNRSVPRYFRVE